MCDTVHKFGAVFPEGAWRMNHYPHHIGDFDKATRHLTRIERSIYRDLIELYYDTEAPLTLDRVALCRRVLARTNEESTAVEQVLNEFFYETPHGWYHVRCEIEIEKYRSNQSAQARAGKASAAARALKAQQAINGRSTDVELSFHETSTAIQQNSTNREPGTVNQEPLNKQDTPRRVQFVKPTFADVRAYCTERKNNVSPNAWLNHYESNGWRVGKNPMKDWKAAIRTWETNGSNGNAKNQHDNRSRAQRVSDELDRIGKASLERERSAGTLGVGNLQEIAGEVSAQVDIGD